MQDGKPGYIRLSATSASRIVLYVQFVIGWFLARFKPDAAERSRSFADNLSNARPTAGVNPLDHLRAEETHKDGLRSKTPVPVVNQIRTYWWCSPPRTGRQRMVSQDLGLQMFFPPTRSVCASEIALTLN